MNQTALLRTVISLVSVLYLGAVLVIGIMSDMLTVNFWINFIFMLLVGIATFTLTFFRNQNSSPYFPFTVQYVKVISIYITFSGLLSLSLMFIKVMLWFVSLAVHIVVALIFAIYVAYSSFGYAHIRAVSEKQRVEVQYLILLETKLSEAHAFCESPQLKTTYEKVIRMVQNSSYRSYPEVESIELELLNKADELMVVDDEGQATIILKEICILLNKRKNTISMLRR